MELLDTLELMASDDYIQRFKAEYYQTKIRLDKLYNTIIKAYANTLDFELKCNIDLLEAQADSMREYVKCLEIRAEIEGIEL